MYDLNIRNFDNEGEQMKYFKYKNVNDNRKYALIEQYRTLTKSEKRIVRKERIWRKISSTVTFAAYLLCTAVGFYLLGRMPKSTDWLESIGLFFF